MNAQSHAALSAVILAGGQSRRMGRDKAWIECGGRPLLWRTLDKVRQMGITEVFVSGRPDGDYAAVDCPVLFDLAPGLGPLGGLERGLDGCSSPLLLVLAVDLPHLTPEFLQALIARSGADTGVVPEHGGWLEPLAAIYPKRCHSFARERILSGQLAAHEFATDCMRARAVKRWRVPPAHATCFVNWNRPDDLDGAPTQAP